MPSTTHPQKEIFLIAGEQSGDLHGKRLMQALKEQESGISFSGVGGPKMRSEGLDCLMPMEDFQIMGVSEILKNIPKILRSFAFIRNQILSRNPSAVIFIDYSGFNLRMAKSLRKRGYKGKLIHYICPTVWAWRKKRIHTLCATLDLLLTIYPFEGKHFEHTPLKVIYAGHPSIEDLKQTPYHPEWREELGIAPRRPLIGIFPGSRKSIVLLDLPKQLLAAKRLCDEDPALAIGISIASEALLPHILEIITRLNLSELLNKTIYLVPEKYTFDLMQNISIAIATSGTVTLELGLHEVPTVVVYDLTKLNAFLAKHIFRLYLPFYCIVNILCEEAVFPELILPNFSIESVYKNAKELLTPGPTRDNCLKGCRKLPGILANSPSQTSPLKPSQKAADAILTLLDYFKFSN